MNPRIHGAPAQALSDALAALSRLASWIVSTADTDLPPTPPVSARAMRDAAGSRALCARPRACSTKPPKGPIPRPVPPGPAAAIPPLAAPSRRRVPEEVEPGSVPGGLAPAGEAMTARPSLRPRRTE